MTSEDRSKDQLGREAEAFELRLRREPYAADSDKFVTDHGDLAETLRLLHCVFHPTPSPGDQSKTSHEAEPLPERVARFRILEQVGQGGFGVVYRAVDEVLHREVALKMIRCENRLHSDQSERILREARALARVNHPHIVPLYEVVCIEQQYYLVSEFSDGITLAAWLRQNPGPIPAHQSVALLRPIAEALAHVHELGLVHRDVKPDNILLSATKLGSTDQSYLPRLTDFGLVHDVRCVTDVDRVRPIAGTLEYMAPEHFTGANAAHDFGCDIYSFGVLLYRLVTGRLPFEGHDSVLLIQHICLNEVTPPRKLIPTLSRDLEAICLKCLERAPHERYTSSRALVADLQRFERGEGVCARPEDFAQRLWRLLRRHPQEAASVGGVIVLLAIVTAVLATLNRNLTTSRRDLADALRTSQVNERRALEAERISASATAVAQRHQTESERNREQAIHTAFRADLPRAIAAWQATNLVEASDIVERMNTYITPPLRARDDFQVVAANVLHGWRRLVPHAGPVHGAVAIAGHPWIASAGGDGVVRIHDITTGQPVQAITGNGRVQATAVGISTNGHTLAIGWTKSLEDPSVEATNWVEIWDLSTRNLVQRFQDYPATIQSLDLSATGDRVAIGVRYQLVAIQTVGDSTASLCLDSARRNHGVYLSSTGSELLLNPVARTFRIVRIDDGTVLSEITAPHNPGHFAWSTDDRRLAVTYQTEPVVSVYEFKDSTYGHTHSTLTQPYGGVTCIAFSPSGRRLAAGLRNGGVVVWDLPIASADGNTVSADMASSAKLLGRWITHVGSITAVVMPTEDDIVSGSEEGTLTAIHVPSLVQRTGDLALFDTSCATLAPDGQSVFLGCRDGRLIECDTELRLLATLLPADTTPVECLLINATTNRLFLVRRGQSPIQISLHPEQKHQAETFIMDQPPSADSIPVVACSTDGQKFVLAVKDRLWGWQQSHSALSADAASHAHWQPVFAVTLPRTADAICFTHDDSQVAYGGLHEDIRTINWETREEQRFATSLNRTSTLLWDASRGRLISGHDDGRIRINDIHGQPAVITRISHQPFDPAKPSSIVTALMLSPNHTTIVSGSEDGAVQMWDAGDLQHLGTLREMGGQGSITGVGFTPDGSRVFYHLSGSEPRDSSVFTILRTH